MRSLTKTAWKFAGVLVLLSMLTATTQSAAQDRSPAIFDLTFKGGTAAEFVDAIRMAAADINIVVAPEAAEVAMPPVSLKQVSSAAALNLLDGKFQERPGRLVRLIVGSMPVYADGERRTYQVQVQIRGNPQATIANVWTIVGLVKNDIASEAVLSAVEMALEVVDSPTPLDVRFHEATGLLIASGDEGQLEAINEVIDRLRDTIGERRDNAMQKLQHQLKTFDTERRDEQQRLGRLAELEAALRQEVEAQRHEMARQELLNAELRRMLEGKDTELAELRAELRAARQELRKRGSPFEPESQRSRD